jgi:protein subunit release factor A
MGNHGRDGWLELSCPQKPKRRRKMIIEVRAAEGGMDAKLLVIDQFRIYTKLAERRGL